MRNISKSVNIRIAVTAGLKNMSNPNVAAGNPCKVLRKITDDDKKMLFRDEEIDEEAWADILERMEFEAAD